MLADWYFCSAVRLTPRTTHDYLDLVDSLRQRRDGDLVHTALTALRQTETSQLLYAVPEILAARHNFATDQRITSLAEELLAQAQQQTDRKIDVRRIDPLGSTDTPVETLRRLAQSVRPRHDQDRPRSSRPYLDTIDFAYEVVALATMANVCERDTGEASAAAAEDPQLSLLLRTASAGSYGRLPALLAWRTYARSAPEKIQKALAAADIGVPWLEPDLLGAAALAWFGAAGDTDFQAIAAEAPACTVPAELSGPDHAHDTRAVAQTCELLGVPVTTVDALAHVLWRVVLAEITVANASPAEAEWLTEWISAPEAGTEVGLPSPWTPRADAWWTVRNAWNDGDIEVNRLTRFREAGNEVALAHLLGAALVAAKMAEQPLTDRVAVNALEFTLHVCDVLTDVRFREPLDALYRGLKLKRPFTLRRPLAGLALHVWKTSEHIGKCSTRAITPDQLVDLVIEGHRSAPLDTERGKLYDTAALLISYKWVMEAASGRTVLSHSTPSGRWFLKAGDNEEPALRLLSWVVATLHHRTADQEHAEQFIGLAAGPQLLLNQLWPQRAVPGLSSWPDRLDAERVKIGAREFILNAPLTVATWRDLSDNAEKRAGSDGAVPAMATERLAAALIELDGSAVIEEWLRVWGTHMDNIHTPYHFGRDLRRRVAQFFELAVPSTVVHKQSLVQALEKAVDILAEFSVNAPNDLFNLLTALTRDPVGVDHQSWQELRLRFLRTLLASTAGLGGEPDVFGSPQRLLADRRNREFRRRSVQLLLAATGSTKVHLPGDREAPLGRAYEIIAAAHDVRATLPTLSISHGDVAAARNVDPRLLRTAAVSHADQTVIFTSAGISSDRLTDLTDLSQMTERERQAWLNSRSGPSTVAGIITAVDTTGGPNSVWVNCGTHNPLPVTTSAQWAVGDLVKITLAPAAGEKQLQATSITALPPVGPNVGDVRPVHVRARTGTSESGQLLTIEVDGVTGAIGPSRTDLSAGARQRFDSWVHRWDPDASAAYREGDEARSLAMYGMDGLWYPFDRSMTDLVAALVQVPGELAAVPATIVDVVREENQHWWRISTGPGVCYLVSESDWATTDLTTLNEERSSSGVEGVRLMIGLETVEGAPPTLVLRGDPDLRNRRWARVFRDQEQSLVAERTSTGSWVVPVEVDGMAPNSVVVRGLEGLRSTAECFAVESWGAAGQRTAVVDATAIQLNRLEKEDDISLERFLRLRHPGSGGNSNLVKIDRAIQKLPERGAWPCRTSDGVLVDVEPESITMLPVTGDRHPTLAVGRSAVIIRTRPAHAPQRNATPARLEDIAPNLDPALLTTAMATQELAALCVAVPKRTTSGTKMYSLWIRIADEIVSVVVPPTLFSTLPQRVSDPVTMLRGFDGRWTASAQPRYLKAVALWSHKERKKPMSSAHLYIGTIDHDGRSWDVSQHPRYSELCFTLVTARSFDHFEAMIGKQEKRYQKPIPDDVEARVHGRNVELATDAGIVTGQANRTTHDVRYRVTDVSLHGYPMLVGGEELWQLTRSFELVPVGRRTVNRSNDHHHEDDWQTWDFGDDHHVIGSVDGDKLTLAELYVPTDGGWTNIVPFDADEQGWIGEHDNRAQARAWLSKVDGQWTASHVLAHPLTVNEFVDQLRQERMSIRPTPTALPVPLRYAGPGEGATRTHRFEWGLGWRVEIPEDQITVAGTRITGALPLFYGEQVKRAAFVVEADRVVMDIDEFTIEHSAGRQILDESRQRIVHRIAVDVSPAKGEVQVRAIYGRKATFADGDSDHSKALRLDHAQLDDTTVRELLKDASRDAVDGETAVRREVLVSLDRDRFLRSRGKDVHFNRVTALTGQQRLFLVAGDIVERDNDVHLELHLPSGLSWGPGRRPAVRVTRRNFAHRQGLLRQLHRSGASLKGSVLLVELMDGRDGFWQGTTRISLSRNVNHLFDYVRNQNGNSYAVLTKVYQRHIGIEFRHGVYFRVPAERIVRHGTLTNGSIVRLAIDEKGNLELFCALHADRMYVPETGRSVVLLPKQTLLRDNVKAATANERAMFTVAGLPDVQPTADRPPADGVEVMKGRHPKIATVCEEDGRTVVQKIGGGSHSGSVVADTRSMVPVIRRTGLHHTAPGRTTTWAQLSFSDLGARQIAESINASGWTVHDRVTGYWPVLRNGNARFTEEILNDKRYINAANGPVFFASDWTLRYPADQLRGFGFPASDLLDGTSSEIGQDPAWYTVAAPVTGLSGGLWIEIAPGRVIELPADLLIASSSHRYRSLRNLDWSRFAPGDRVELSLHQRGDDSAQVRCVTLHSWKPGPRAALTGRRALLPIGENDRTQFKLTLGRGRCELDYPVTPQQLRKQSDPRFGWLAADNTFTLLTGADEPQADDVLLLTLSKEDGTPQIDGLPGWTVELAEGNDEIWPGSEWLRSALATDTGLRRLLGLVGGALPMTVESAGEARVVVSRRLQPPGQVGRGRWLRGELLGSHGDRDVLIAAGASLVTIDVDDLVPGLPDDLASAVVQTLAGQQNWYHADDNGNLHPGLPPEREKSRSDTWTTVLQPVFDRGVLARQTDTGALRWLPASELGWVSNLSAAEVRNLVQRWSAKPVLCTTRPDGTVSLTDVRDGRSRFDALRPGNTFRVQMITERTQGRGKRQLAAIYQMDTLVEFQADGRSGFPLSEDPIFVEVLRIESAPAKRVVVVEQGSRKVRLDLPRVLLTELRNPGEPIYPGRWLSSNDLRLVELLDREDDEDGRSDALAAWWGERGKAVVGMSDESVDAVALCAASIVADDLGHGQLSVWLAWQAGARALSSQHVGAIVTEWIKHPERLRSGEWQRLTKVSDMLRTEISVSTVAQVVEFASGVVHRMKVRNEPGLTAVAISLLTAVGAQGHLPAKAASQPRLADLENLGRALTPPRDLLTAQPSLLPMQKDLLHQTCADLFGDRQPFPLLPSALPIPSELAEQLLDLASAASGPGTVDKTSDAVASGEGPRADAGDLGG